MEDRAAASHPAPSFGILLRAFRLRGGLSQELLAERARISAKAIGAIEQGARRAPYRQTVELLVDALQLEPAEQETFRRTADAARGRAVRHAPAESPGPATGLPRPLTPFIDRTEVADIVALLKKHRLVTLTGSGGVGKTRTAIEAATRYVRGIGISAAFVDLSAINDKNLITGQIANALDVRVRDSGDAMASLVDNLASRTLLIIFDNCEHFVAGAAGIAGDLLRRCPSISILTTSRELLGLSNEVVYRLPSLQIPDSNSARLTEALSYSAVALFIQRARYADAKLVLGDEHVPAIIEICRKLNGIPLAIELVAARLPNTGIETLRARLKELSALSGGRDLPARQQTMNATISWSFDLLNQAEGTLLERISAFTGSFTLSAAEMVCSGTCVPAAGVAELLTRLVDKSLLNVVDRVLRTRYTLLESIRNFGLERLCASQHFLTVARRHAEWLALNADLLADGIVPTADWIEELDNARSAIEWCLDSGQQSDIALGARIAGGMRRVWNSASREAELKSRVLELLERLDDSEQNYTIIARLWRARLNADRIISSGLIEEARPFLERAGDYEAVAASFTDLALVEARSGAFDRANAALARAAVYFDTLDVAAMRRTSFLFGISKAWVLSAQGEFELARSDLLSLRNILREQQQEADIEAYLTNVLAEIAFALGNVAQAIDLCEQSISLSIGSGVSDRAMGSTRLNLCCYLLARGDLDGAERAGAMFLARAWTQQFDPNREDPTYDSIGIQHLAAIAACRKQSQLAARLLGFIDETFRRGGVAIDHLPLTEKYSYDVLTASLETQLSPHELAKYRIDGAALDFRGAAELVLTLPNP